MEIGTILADARRAAGLQQKEVAEALGISPSYLCDLESNRRPFPLARVERLPPAIRSRVAAAILASREADALLLGRWVNG